MIIINDIKEEVKDAEFKDSDNSDSGYDVSSEIRSMTESPESSNATHLDDICSLVRICVSVAFYNPLAQRVEVALLGVRSLSESNTIANALKDCVHQVSKLNIF